MNTMIAEKPEHWALLVLPRVRVQNANAISSPMTWGFPAITAFLGLMTGLERRLGPDSGICFKAVGVVCHDFEAQVTTEGFTRAFHLTRNPVGADGSTAGIVEEGRVHLELTLVFSVQLSSTHLGDAERQALAGQVAHALAGMRLAGGSVMPPLPGGRQRRPKPFLELEAQGEEAERQQMRKLARVCLPGFALVSRHDLLTQRLHCRIGSSEKMKATTVVSIRVHCRIGSSENLGGPAPGTRAVHCRIGSSENRPQPDPRRIRVHCRIGSSEIYSDGCVPTSSVHCRIGSSEMPMRDAVHRAQVHCRIGSSEMRANGSAGLHAVHCRIGSSEMPVRNSQHPGLVHCRIGSSEKTPGSRRHGHGVHCRIGSSEIHRQRRQRCAAVHCRIGSSENQLLVALGFFEVHCRIGSSEINL